MSKKSRRSAPAILDHPADHGHAFERVRARLVPTGIGASQGMTLAEIADPDRPSVRGATVKVALRDDPLWAILSAERQGDGRIIWGNPADSSRHAAAVKLRDDTDLAFGLRSQDSLMLSGIAAPGSSSPTQVMLDAHRRCRKAWTAVKGPEGANMVADTVRLVVLGRTALLPVAQLQHCRYYTARDRLFLGLDRLADFYGL